MDLVHRHRHDLSNSDAVSISGTHPGVTALRNAEEAFEALLRNAARGADGAMLPVTREQIIDWFESTFVTVHRMTALEAHAASALLTRNVPRLALSVRAFVFQLVDALDAHARALEASRRPLATQVGVKRDADLDETGTIWATIGGHHVTLGAGAVKAWLLGEGRFVAWSGLDGSGGFENEGQSLRVHDTATGESRRVMCQEYEIDRVTSHRLTNGQWALLVEMSDGAQDGDHFALVHPSRGERFCAPLAVRVDLNGDLLTLGYLESSELVRPALQRVPYRSQTFDLKSLIGLPDRTRRSTTVTERTHDRGQQPAD